jgi:hypothetical protein
MPAIGNSKDASIIYSRATTGMKAATVRQHNMDARKKGVLANVVKLTVAWKDMYKINKL